MTNFQEIKEQLIGISRELENEAEQRRTQVESIKVEEKKQEAIMEREWQERKRILQENFGPIFELINNTLLRGEGRVQDYNIREGNPQLELVWGSEYERGGPKPTHSIVAIHFKETQCKVEFGWLSEEFFDVSKSGWENDFIESLRTAFKEGGCRRISRGGGSE